MAKVAPFHLPQAWFNVFETHEWINRYLLENIPAAAWHVETPEGKGRTVAAIFAHIQNVRVMGWKAAARENKIAQQLIATASLRRKQPRDSRKVAPP